MRGGRSRRVARRRPETSYPVTQRPGVYRYTTSRSSSTGADARWRKGSPARVAREAARRRSHRRRHRRGTHRDRHRPLDAPLNLRVILLFTLFVRLFTT